MYFLIEYDTRRVVSKAATDKEFIDFLKKHKLQMAFAVVGGEDDMALELSQGEMQGVFDRLTDKHRKFGGEDEAASVTWAMINACKDKIPTISPKVRRALLKDGGGGIPPKDDTPAKSTAKKPKAAAAKPAKRRSTNALSGVVFAAGGATPKPGTAHAILTDFIEDNMGEASYEELITHFADVYRTRDGEQKDEKFAHGYVIGAIKKDFIAEDDL